MYLLRASGPKLAVVGRSGGATASATSHSITAIPAGSADELVIVLASLRPGFALSTTSSGWTKLFGGNDNNDPNLDCFIGVGPGALTLTCPVAGVMAYNSYRISGWSGTASQVQGATATSSSGSANPPNLAPALGSRQYLWIAAGATGTGGNIPTGLPAGFTDLTSRNSGGTSSSHSNIASAERILTASSQDPAAFTNTSDDWVAATIAVPAAL